MFPTKLNGNVGQVKCQMKEILTLPRFLGYCTAASSPVVVPAVDPEATLTVVAISALLGGSG